MLTASWRAVHRELTQQTLLQYTSAILSGDVPALGPASEDDPKGTELEKIDGVYKIVGKNFNPMVLSDDRLCVLSTACVWHRTQSQAPPCAANAKRPQVTGLTSFLDRF